MSLKPHEHLRTSWAPAYAGVTKDRVNLQHSQRIVFVSFTLKAAFSLGIECENAIYRHKPLYRAEPKLNRRFTIKLYRNLARLQRFGAE